MRRNRREEQKPYLNKEKRRLLLTSVTVSCDFPGGSHTSLEEGGSQLTDADEVEY
jgi:hypothetical protein